MTVRRLLRTGALSLVAVPLAAQGDATGVFAEANDLFAQANEARVAESATAPEIYRRAALRYERLVGEYGIRNSMLFYNLGNAYFQAGDVGRAIVNYKRAEDLDPSDANVRRNLALARSQRADKLDASVGGQATRTLLFWHYDVSTVARMRIFVVAWVVFWTLVILRFVGLSWVPREIALASVAVALLLFGSLAVDAVDASQSVEGVIVAADSVARQGDGASYEPAFREALHAGAEFRVLEQRPEWLRVELPDGRLCWLPVRDVELVP